MNYYEEYKSPLGKIFLISDGENLTGLYFENQKNFPDFEDIKKKNLEIFEQTKEYLNCYFQGKNPKIKIPIKLEGTPFQEEVYEELRKIPYGETRTYKEIAEQIAKKRNLKGMSSQAVGGAVGKNKISIIVPCHRVLGSNHKLVGYAGGLDRKSKLLELEGCKEKFKEEI